MVKVGMPRGPARRYKNEPTVLEGHRFDSKKEAKRYAELVLMQKAGEIRQLAVHPRYDIPVCGMYICRYIGDFSYLDYNDEEVVEDVKSPPTRKNPVYRLKKKLMLAVHDIDITEV